MRRRNFLRQGFAISSSSVLAGTTAFAKSPVESGSSLKRQYAFNLKYAPHFGLFQQSAGEDLIEELKFIEDAGFTAFEDPDMKSRDVASQEKIANELSRLKLEMGCFNANQFTNNEPGLASGESNTFLMQIKESVEVAKRVNAKYLLVSPGLEDQKKNIGYQTANVIESLKQACEILESQKLVMLIKPLNSYEYPGMFLKDVPQAYEICKSVGSPSCKILFDIYNQQVQGGNLIANIDMAWKEIGYFHLADNPGKTEPTTGEINFKNILKHIYKKGYEGILGMSHGKSGKGKDGEKAVMNAYAEIDNFN